jgi:hypothetical protein
MATSLYDLSVATYLQTVGAVTGFLERGAKHYREAGFDPDDLSGVRLYEDMARFHFQIRSVAHHSVGALEAVKSGAFLPPPAGLQPIPYADLQAMIAKTDETLRAYTPEEVNGWAGKEVSFQAGDYRLPFTAENFILSFSLPNFHFHATTAYDILRMKGVPLGKRHYLGRLRLKAP